MKPPILVLIREQVVHVPGAESFTPGRLYVSGLFFGFTCEDEDRNLERNNEDKQYGRTAIPRGTFKVEVSHSPRFGKQLPAVLDVPGFSGIRIHGGNRAEDSLGCILLGKVRTATGIAQCADTVQRLISLIKAYKAKNEPVWLEVK